MASVRIYQKKQIRLDRLNFRQAQMFKIGNVGVAAVKNRVAAGQGPTDASAKPLTKRYAIQKTKIGKGNRRDLSFTGDMLRNFLVRTVSENKAKASNSTRKDRLKAWINNKIEPWILFSPRNRTAVLDATNRILIENKSRLLVEKALGGKQQ
jgi:hypothetical protein